MLNVFQATKGAVPSGLDKTREKEHRQSSLDTVNRSKPYPTSTVQTSKLVVCLCFAFSIISPIGSPVHEAALHQTKEA